jgi:hypothetical protein
MGLLPSIAIAGYWQHHTASGRSHPPEALIAGSRRIAGAQISGDTVANCTSGPIYGELRSCRLRTLDSRQGGRQQWLTGNDNVEDGQPHGRADNNRDAGAAIRKERRLSRAQCGRPPVRLTSRGTELLRARPTAAAKRQRRIRAG